MNDTLKGERCTPTFENIKEVISNRVLEASALQLSRARPRPENGGAVFPEAILSPAQRYQLPRREGTGVGVGQGSTRTSGSICLGTCSTITQYLLGLISLQVEKLSSTHMYFNAEEGCFLPEKVACVLPPGNRSLAISVASQAIRAYTLLCLQCHLEQRCVPNTCNHFPFLK